MQRVRRWLSWLWPVFAAGFLFVQLVDAEEWARHTLPHVGPPSREMLVALDREHTMTMGALHARVERVEGTCQVHAFLHAEGTQRGDVAMRTPCEGNLLVEVRYGLIMMRRHHPRLHCGAPMGLGGVAWVSFAVVSLLLTQLLMAVVRRDLLVHNARPCLIREGMVTFVDGESPSQSVSAGPCSDGVGWACVRSVYGGTYRESPYFPCDVLADRDGAITACHRETLVVALSLACIGFSWLHFLMQVA
jgi:hypothetical protein